MNFERLMEDWIMPLLILGVIIGGIVVISGMIKY